MAKSGDMSFYLDPQSLVDVNRKLSQLGEVEKEGVIAQGLKEGAQIISKQARSYLNQRVKKKTGNLSRSVGVHVRKKDNRSYAGYRRPIGSHAHLIEFGTKQRATRTGANRGSVQGKYFHTDAVNQRGDEALKTVQESIEISIKRIMDRN